MEAKSHFKNGKCDEGKLSSSTTSSSYLANSLGSGAKTVSLSSTTRGADDSAATLAAHPALSNYWRRTTSRNLDDSSDEKKSSVRSSISGSDYKGNLLSRTLDRRSDHKQTSFGEDNYGDGSFEEDYNNDDEGSEIEAIDEELDEEERENHGLLPCSDGEEEDEDDYEDDCVLQHNNSLYLGKNMTLPNVFDPFHSPVGNSLDGSIMLPIQENSQSMHLKIVLSIGPVTKIISSDINFEDLQARLEADIGEAIIIRYQDHDDYWLNIKSDADFRRILDLHHKHSKAHSSALVMPLRLVVEPADRPASPNWAPLGTGGGGDSTTNKAEGVTQLSSFQIPVSLLPPSADSSPDEPRRRSLTLGDTRGGYVGGISLSSSPMINDPNYSFSSQAAFLQQQQQQQPPGRPSVPSSAEAVFPKGRLSTSTGAQDLTSTARFRSTSGHDPVRPMHFQFQDHPLNASVGFNMTNTMNNTLNGKGTMRCSSRTGIGMLAIQSPTKRPPIKAEAQSKGALGLFPQAKGGGDEKRADALDSSGDSVSQTGAEEGEGGVPQPSSKHHRHKEKDPLAFAGPVPSLMSSMDMGFLSNTLTQQPPAIIWAKGKKLGNGAFGSVFSALDLKTGLHFAVKQVLMGGTAGSTTRKKQGRALQREVYYLESLSHPNIVRILGTQRTKQKLTIFLEHASDGSLAQMMSEFGPLSEGIIRSYTRQILDGLRYLHRNKIIHRDIKPANILIDKGQVKLADFGASKRLDEEVMAQGIQGVTGTLMYMAPEVLQSADGGGYGRRADVWSLGITLNELAYGKHPFDSLEDALIRACESQEPVPGFPPFFSKEAHEFLALCLVRDPKIRWSAAKLRRHEFCSLSDDPALVERHQLSSPYGTGRRTSWLTHGSDNEGEGENGSPDVSETAAMNSISNEPFNDVSSSGADGRGGGGTQWGKKLRRISAGHHQPPHSPDWDNLASPQVVTSTRGKVDGFRFDDLPAEDESKRREEDGQGSPIPVVHKRWSLSMAKLKGMGGEDDGRPKPCDEVTPTTRPITPEERRRPVNNDLRTPLMR